MAKHRMLATHFPRVPSHEQENAGGACALPAKIGGKVEGKFQLWGFSPDIAAVGESGTQTRSGARSGARGP